MLIIADKPSWITSYDCIRALKKLYPKQKIWHSGTLDPMASWMMIIWVAKWTKQLNQIQWLDKTYITQIDFSKSSDTRDMDYRDFFEERKPDSLNPVSTQDLTKKLDSLIPEYNLPLPPFSAKKKDWQKLYDLARKWEWIFEDRVMKINNYEILNYDFPTLKLQLDVGSWSYIRSIGYWLGQEFNNGWLLTSLRRESIWKYHFKNFQLDKEAIWWKDDIEHKIMFCEVELNDI